MSEPRKIVSQSNNTVKLAIFCVFHVRLYLYEAGPVINFQGTTMRFLTLELVFDYQEPGETHFLAVFG